MDVHEKHKWLTRIISIIGWCIAWARWAESQLNVKSKYLYEKQVPTDIFNQFLKLFYEPTYSSLLSSTLAFVLPPVTLSVKEWLRCQYFGSAYVAFQFPFSSMASSPVYLNCLSVSSVTLLHVKERCFYLMIYTRCLNSSIFSPPSFIFRQTLSKKFRYSRSQIVSSFSIKSTFAFFCSLISFGYIISLFFLVAIGWWFGVNLLKYSMFYFRI